MRPVCLPTQSFGLRTRISRGLETSNIEARRIRPRARVPRHSIYFYDVQNRNVLLVLGEHRGFLTHLDAQLSAFAPAKYLQGDLVAHTGGARHPGELGDVFYRKGVELHDDVTGDEGFFRGSSAINLCHQHTVRHADAFVSTGNNDEPAALDAVERLIGRGPLPGISGDLKNRLTVPVGRIHGATNLLGFNKLSCRDY